MFVPWYHHVSKSAHQLSLAQLEERKTVTAFDPLAGSNRINRNLEARGSIPRGETSVLHYTAMLYVHF